MNVHYIQFYQLTLFMKLIGLILKICLFSIGDRFGNGHLHLSYYRLLNLKLFRLL